MSLRHEEKTYLLRSLIFSVRNEMGTGWPEQAYQDGFCYLAKRNDVPVRPRVRKSLYHRGHHIHTFEADLIAWDLIILELKVLTRGQFTPDHLNQIIQYLKFWQKDLGLLVDFGPSRVRIQRIIRDEPQLEVVENRNYLHPNLTPADSAALDTIRDVILSLAHEYGLGYPAAIYRPMVALELRQAGLHCDSDITLMARINGDPIYEHRSDHILVEGRYLLNVQALYNRLDTHAYLTTRTYLRSLSLKLGLVINFGKRALHIEGVSQA